MSNTGCTVTFDGTYGGTYNVPCDQVQYINDELINVGSSSTIYLYPAAAQSSRNQYIALQSMLYPRYYSGSGYGYTEITNASNVTFNGLGNLYAEKTLISTGTEIILIVFCLLSLLIKK